MRRGYMSEDITYCASDCSLTGCVRNKKNIRQMIPHSFALLEGTEECLKHGNDIDRKDRTDTDKVLPQGLSEVCRRH